jgi:hypothetical protein
MILMLVRQNLRDRRRSKKKDKQARRRGTANINARIAEVLSESSGLYSPLPPPQRTQERK